MERSTSKQILRKNTSKILGLGMSRGDSISRPSYLRRNTSRFGLPKNKSLELGDADGSQQLNWTFTRLENTYQLHPTKLFPHAKAEQMIAEELEKALEDVTYEPEQCMGLAMELSETLKTKAKTLDAPRYKLVVLVQVGEKKDQGMKISSRCLWNHETDTFASASYKNRSIYAFAIIYATYFE